MANFVFKSSNNILKAGNNILISTDQAPEAAFDINPETFGLLNNDLVPELPDASGNGLAFRQDDTTKQATFLTDGLNGKPILRFSGDVYEIALAAAVRTVFVVVRSAVVTQNYGSLFHGTGGSNGYFLAAANSNCYFDPGTGNGTVFGDNANKNRLFVNGVQAEPKGAALRQTYFTLMSLDVADHQNLNINISKIGFSSSYFNGDYARIIGYKNRLTELQRKDKEQELINYYGL